jgi:hypothetical protein
MTVMENDKKKLKNRPKCIFCGIELNKKNISIEHIIPNSIYPTNKLVIRNFCKKCNNKLGRICEQPAIPYLKELMAELILRGYPLEYGRRKKKSEIINQGIGWGAMTFGDKREGMPIRMQIDTITKQRQFVFEPSWVKKDYLDSSTISSDEGRAIFPLFENKGSKEMQKLGHKIIFELCYILWKEDFLKTNAAKELKDMILNSEMDETDTESLEWEIPLFPWKELDGHEDIKKEIPLSHLSFFDNPPHITFAIIKIKDLEPIAILNFFGMFEATIRLFKNDIEINNILEKEQAIVLIIKQTGKKEILKLNPETYLKWQKKKESPPNKNL